MANAEHLEILKEGVVAWNEWREKNGSAIRPELGEADLSEADLSQVNLKEADLRFAHLRKASLRGASLSEANLGEASLSEANLSEANLSFADLIEADLSGARLNEADLSFADLTRANLSKASLKEANLGGANLRGARLNEADLHQAILIEADLGEAILVEADLTGARFVRTNLADVDLSEARGLDRVEHFGPSTIGLDTFFKSKGKIPEVFLRGAGVPDIFLQYAASLIGTAFEFHSCFISCSTRDDGFVKRLFADLQGKGVRCWFAPDNLKIGDKFRLSIDEAIRVYDKLLIVLSKHSVQSDWVEKEVETAFEKERREKRAVLFPIRVDQAVMDVEGGWAADIRRTRHIGDFRKWKDHDAYAQAFERLLRDLKSDRSKPDPMPT